MNAWSNIYRHHRWSNLVMIGDLSNLTDEQLSLSVPSTYGSSIDTIRRVISSDADYVRIIPVPQIAEDGPFSRWEELRLLAPEAERGH